MSKKIMIADDNPVVHDLVSAQMAVLGHEVAGVETNGKNVLATYRRLNPDLLILDISFEDTDGLTVLRQLRAAYPEAKVLVLSANDQKETRSIVTKLKAAFLAKPFAVADIQAAVAKIFAQSSSNSAGAFK